MGLASFQEQLERSAAKVDASARYVYIDIARSGDTVAVKLDTLEYDREAGDGFPVITDILAAADIELGDRDLKLRRDNDTQPISHGQLGSTVVCENDRLSIYDRDRAATDPTW